MPVCFFVVCVVFAVLVCHTLFCAGWVMCVLGWVMLFGLPCVCYGLCCDVLWCGVALRGVAWRVVMCLLCWCVCCVVECVLFGLFVGV